MKTLIRLLIATALLQAAAHALTDQVTSIDLGDGLKAEIGYKSGKVLHLPGREVPIWFPYGSWVLDAKLSEDRRTLLLVLCQRRYNVGSDYLCCLYCQRSNTTASATWDARFVLHAPNLGLMFNRHTSITGVESLSNDGTATLKIGRFPPENLPGRVERTSERWHILREEQLGVGDKSPEQE